MASYINREDVIEEINDAISNIAFTSPYQNDICAMVSGMERVLDIVEDAFACDVVEVVRCKDCRKFTPFVEPYHAVGQCRRMNGLIQETDFCSYGERKDNV